MRIFLICMLVVGALAEEVTKKTDNKHEKRGLLPGHSSSGYNGQQLLGGEGHEHSEYQQAAYSGLGSGISSGSGYTSGLSYTAGSLPISHQTYSSGAYDNLGGQSTLQQFGQGSFVHGGVHQLGQDFQGFEGSISTSHQPIQSSAISPAVEIPVPVPHPEQVTRTVQGPVPHPVPVQVRRPVSVPQAIPVYVYKTYPVNVDPAVPAPVPQSYETSHPVQVPIPVAQYVPAPIEVPQQSVQINSGHEASVGQAVLVGGPSYEQGSNLDVQGASFYDNGAALGSLGGHQQLDLGPQHHNFGSSGIFGDVGLGQSFDTSFKTSSYQEQHVQPSLVSTASKNQGSGYTYDVPTKKFTF